MNVFIRSTSQILKGALKAFQTFPAAIGSALAFAIVTMVRIQLDWPQQELYNFLFNCLHWSLAFGAVFSLAAITGAKSRYPQTKAFLIANSLGVAAVVVTFLALYFFGGTKPPVGTAQYDVVSALSAIRVTAAILISAIVFIYLAGFPKDQSDFSRSLFMTQKAFFIALIYGLVIMGGASGVARTIQALLYQDMSNKVYMYIGTVTGFMAFTIFVGYFPNFLKGYVDEHREVAQKQPRFIEVLFQYIAVPIVLALTVVLLIWAAKTMFSGAGYSFAQLSGIATAYALVGIWLHTMVTHLESGLANFYRRVYPIAALVILAFEAWALVIQLQKFGLKTTEYAFIVIWIIAFVSAILLLIRKDRAHPTIAALTCVMAVFSILPVLGYQALPVTAQISRLEKLLTNQNLLVSGQLVPAVNTPEVSVRESITDSVSFLAQAEDAKLPVWFAKDLGQSNIFSAKFGFDQTWPQQDFSLGNPSEYLGTNLMLQPEPLDISGYRWAFSMQSLVDYGKGQSFVTVKGQKGLYRINWTLANQTGLPTLTIELDNRVILNQSMKDYIDRIAAKYPPGQNKSNQAPLKDMSLQLETPEISVMLVFNNININVNTKQDVLNYGLNLGELYLKEKP